MMFLVFTAGEVEYQTPAGAIKQLISAADHLIIVFRDGVREEYGNVCDCRWESDPPFYYYSGERSISDVK